MTDMEAAFARSESEWAEAVRKLNISDPNHIEAWLDAHLEADADTGWLASCIADAHRLSQSPDTMPNSVVEALLREVRPIVESERASCADLNEAEGEAVAVALLARIDDLIQQPAQTDVEGLLREARGMILGDIEYGLEEETAFIARIDHHLTKDKSHAE